ncbi:MAG TPA: alkaline phosphatase, partial [Burkholderiaceae bacterium]|nr:alkaline phosphatase [Burkholderiaceae bacterium]
MQQRSLWMAALAAALVVAGCGSGDSPPAAPATSVPKNVIFLLGDGYGIVPMTAARIYAVGEDGELEIDK